MTEKDLRLARILQQIYDLRLFKLGGLRKRKDLKIIKKLVGDEFKANEKILITLYNKGLRNRHKKSSAFNNYVRTALRKWKY